MLNELLRKNGGVVTKSDILVQCHPTGRIAKLSPKAETLMVSVGSAEILMISAGSRKLDAFVFAR